MSMNCFYYKQDEGSNFEYSVFINLKTKPNVEVFDDFWDIISYGWLEIIAINSSKTLK